MKLVSLLNVAVECLHEIVALKGLSMFFENQIYHINAMKVIEFHNLLEVIKHVNDMCVQPYRQVFASI